MIRLVRSLVFLAVIPAFFACHRLPDVTVIRAPGRAAPTRTLKLAHFAYVEATGIKRFDLSGIQQAKNGDLFILNDKTPVVYRIPGTPTGRVRAEPVADLKALLGHFATDFALASIRRRPDGTYWIANEAKAEVFRWDPAQNFATLPFPRLSHELRGQGMNQTLGLAAVCENDDTLFLIKQKDPIKIFAVDPNSGAIRDIFEWNFGEVDSDLTDCAYRDGDLYFLNRSGRRIYRVRWTNDEITYLAEWTFEWIDQDPRFSYWTRDQTGGIDHPDWGTAQALDIDDRFVYVGLNNNGQSLRSDPGEKRPAILVFDRPN